VHSEFQNPQHFLRVPRSCWICADATWPFFVSASAGDSRRLAGPAARVPWWPNPSSSSANADPHRSRKNGPNLLAPIAWSRGPMCAALHAPGPVDPCVIVFKPSNAVAPSSSADPRDVSPALLVHGPTKPGPKGRVRERLIGTIPARVSDRTLFWTAADLEMKLARFQRYYNVTALTDGMEQVLRP